MKWFHRHNFNQWKVIEKGTKRVISNFTNKPVDVWMYLIQERACKTCGYTQLWEERT